jgi:hypothetical protein
MNATECYQVHTWQNEVYSGYMEIVAINKICNFLPEFILYEKDESQRTVTVDEMLLKEMSP